MDWPSLILLSFALCFDSVAVSAIVGMCCNTQSGKDILRSYIPRLIRFCLILGLMQGLMPFIGWLVACNFRQIIEKWDHWIAFGLLLMIGGKMVIDYFREDENSADSPKCPLFEQYTSFSNSTILGIATSIDALIIGVSMAMIDLQFLPESGSQFSNMLLGSAIIAITTFFCAIVGAVLGKYGSKKVSQKSSIIGGVILILIGAKILLEHLDIF